MYRFSRVRARRGGVPFAGLSVLALAIGVALAEEAVPPPARVPARVIVSGRTSTLVDVKVVAVGSSIPRTYSGDLVKNAPGFSWYVSQHYALKTDYKPDKAAFYLTLLELAYPHYVELFGAEPPGIAERRMAVVYASSAEKLKEALLADGIRWDLGGGGITFERIRCAYVYPSGTLDYHQRYILLHECTHLFHMCLAGTSYNTPAWYYEGIADSLGSLVYDARRRQLTVNVLDRPTTHDHFDEGMIAYRKTPLSPQEINAKDGAERGLNFLLIHYFADSPDRAQRFRIWRDEMFRLMPQGDAVRAESGRLLQELFGPWSRLNADFKTWVESRHNTFHYAEWGWEQDANTLWSYGFAEGDKLSQTDVFLVPNEKPAYDPLRMDYPAEAMPPLVGPVERGVAEPSVGCVVDFSRCPGRGRAGIGLGLVREAKPPANCLKLLIEKGSALTMDGSDLGLEKKTVPFPAELVEAAKAGGHRFGMTAKIAKDALEVTLRAGDPARKPAQWQASLPIAGPARERLLSKPLTILARDGWHGVTPFFDDRRRPEPDLLTPAPPNRWRNPGDHALAAVYKAIWRLGQNAPASLLAMRDAMLAAVTQGPEAQKQALAAFDAGVVKLLQDVRRCGAPPECVERASADLVGLSLQLELASDSAPHHARMAVLLRGPLIGEADGQLEFAVEPPNAFAAIPAPERLRLAAGESLLTKRVYRLADGARPFEARATATLAWRGERVTLTATRAARPSINAWWVIGPFGNPKGDTQDLAHPVEQEKIALDKTYPGLGGKRIGWRKVLRDEASDLAAEHLVDFIQLYGPTENAAAYALVWLDAPKPADAVLALGSDDGAVVWLNGERVHTNLVPRPYRAKADRVPLHLKAGRNQLLVKITQGMGDWSFAAYLEDPEGQPLRSVTATLEAP